MTKRPRKRAQALDTTLSRGSVEVVDRAQFWAARVCGSAVSATRPATPRIHASNTLKEIGLPARVARSTAWRQMVQQAPAAILADGLGAQRGTAAHHAKIAGADYASHHDRLGLAVTSEQAGSP